MYKLLQFRFLFFIILVSSFPENLFAQGDVNIFGYFSTRLEKVWNEPSLNNGQIIEETGPAEWSYPFVNIMMQSRLSNKFRVFINLKSDIEDKK